MKKMQSLTVKIDSKLLERIRNAVAATPQLSVSHFVHESLSLCIDAFEEKNGGPFPQRQGKLTTGPRV